MSEGAQGTPVLTDLRLTLALQQIDYLLKDVKDLLKSRNRVNLILRELKDENAKLKEEVRQLRDQDIKRIKPGGIVIFNRMVYLPRISYVFSPPFDKQSIEQQTTGALLRLKSLLCDAGTTLEHLLRVSVYLDDLRNKPEMRDAWDRFFESEGIPEEVRPVPIVHAVRMLDRSGTLDLGLSVEMTAEAALPTAASGGPIVLDKRVTIAQNPTVQEYEVDPGNTISKKTRRSPRKRNREWTQEQMDERIRVKRENTQARAEPEPEAEYWVDEDGYECTDDVNASKATQHGRGWQKYDTLTDAPESCPDNLYVCTVKSNGRTDRYWKLFDETGKLLPFEDCDTKGQPKKNVHQEVLRSKVAVMRYLTAA